MPLRRPGGGAMLRSVGSFAALHVRCADPDRLVQPVGTWLARQRGFAGASYSQGPLDLLGDFRLRANAVALGRIGDAWSIVRFNGFSVGGRFIDESVIRPLAAELHTRAVLFTAQTTSDVYQLVVMEGGTRLRSILADADTCETTGEALPGEPAGGFTTTSDEGDDPPGAMEVAEAVCAELGFALWPDPPMSGTFHVWKRRGLLARLFHRGDAR